MTTEPLPADWAIERALELAGSPYSVVSVKLHPAQHRAIIAHARTLEKYETAPVDRLKAEAEKLALSRGFNPYGDPYFLALAALKRGIEIERERGK